jgi:hypothetical protein
MANRRRGARPMHVELRYLCIIIMTTVLHRIASDRAREACGKRRPLYSIIEGEVRM